MPSEFEIIFDDFSSELDALSEMAAVPTRATAAFSPRARVAAANGATLLLAAIFEEFIRQEVKATFKEKTKRAKSFADFPKKMTAVVWRRSLEMLARTPFDEVLSDISLSDSKISAIVAFCLKKEIGADVSESVAHNDNNMKANQLNGLFNGIGIPSVCSKVCEDKTLIDFLGCESAGKANSEFEARVDEFFKRRNAIAHAIKIGSSSGPAGLHQDIELFRNFGRALFRTIDASMA
ncbi:hypothetical protein X747_09440 [Mesorhizobium sp. LNJC384A00]|uniref:HEPN domain-containing protein n=1 Tax=Mesorhizobium sp. LNJC384A00 TaxID=1287268 RepID=UPI0003CE1096|nr:HEPN domain-containing protein [Mesorhizobium sp. LNJC384A00]ESY44113.1 hypothetical protein X747_09440 [Mesorhizobium sp. LNJC384A00]